MSDQNELAIQNASELKKGEIMYTPIGEKAAIKLSMPIITKFLARPTRGGHMPKEQDIMQFMMLCKARELNPFVGDAHLVGYDSQDGPNFSLITAKQAYDKRAEMNDEYDGIESGIVVLKNDGQTIDRREGVIILPNEEILGAWAIVFRKDRDRPTKHDVLLSAYDSNRGRWKTDKPGMIVKCAEAGALRKAFPNTYSGLYLEEEMMREQSLTEITVEATDEPQKKSLPGSFIRKPAENSDEKEEPVIPDPEPEPEPEPEPQKEETQPELPAEEVKEEPPKKETKTKRATPKSKTKEETPPSEFAAEHLALINAGKDHGLSEVALLRAAAGFFGEEFSNIGAIPVERAAQMTDSIEDVKAMLEG